MSDRDRKTESRVRTPIESKRKKIQVRLFCFLLPLLDLMVIAPHVSFTNSLSFHRRIVGVVTSYEQHFEVTRHSWQISDVGLPTQRHPRGYR